MTYPAIHPPVVNPSNWNATVRAAIHKPASYIVYDDGTDCYALNGSTGVLDYGGSDDEGSVDGADDAAVIQAAIDALASTGGTVFLKQGSYNIGTMLNLNQKNVYLVGETSSDPFGYGDQGVELTATAALNPIVWVHAHGCAVNNIRLVGGDSAVVGIRIQDCRFCHFHNLSVDRALNTGVYIWGNSALTGNHEFRNLKIYMPNDTGAAQVIIRGLVLEGDELAYSTTCCTFYSTNIIVKGVTTSYGVDFVQYSDGYKFYDLRVGKSAGTLTAGIIFNSGDTGNDVNVENNDVFGYGCDVGSDYTIIQNKNTIPNRVWASEDDTEPILIQNSGLLKMYGYPYENGGYSTGTGGEQTIAHGCNFTPTESDVYLSERSTGGALAYQSSAPDATNIYVTATNTKDYNWKVEQS